MSLLTIDGIHIIKYYDGLAIVITVTVAPSNQLKS